MLFLKWLSEKTAQPVSSIYRNATFDSFREWKIKILLDEYKIGSIGFKQLCTLANVTFSEGTLLLQDNDIEPPIAELVDDYTSRVRESMKSKDIFKEGKSLERKSREVDS